MPNCCTSIFVLVQNGQHCVIIPAIAFLSLLETILVWMFQMEVTAWCQYAVYVQNFCNLSSRFPCQCKIKNSSYNRSRFRVNRQFVANGRMKTKSVRRNASHILTLFHHLQFSCCGFHRQVFTVEA